MELDISNAEPSHFMVQEILLPKSGATDALYLKYISGYAEINDLSLFMDKGAKVSFNSYFNSFYESYWVDCAPVKDLVLEISFDGSLLVEIYRDSKDSGCQLIWFQRIVSDGVSGIKVRIPVNGLGEVGESGRIFADFSARKKSHIKKVSFKTTTPPLRKPKISLGICTFKREPFLFRNLQAILDDKEAAQCIDNIIVVNQGPTFSTPSLTKLIAQSDRILLIEQGNHGGCGGFTRTMHEALKLEGVTHHVLMDDDASIDARILSNLANFLAYSSEDIVVGGHMLDLLRPTVLYEAGAVVKPNSRIRSLHHNYDLRTVESLIPFNKCHFSDYNAWWFCAIPTKHIEEAQLPAPIFIRGDDMEYGIRLQERGVKTIAMPGIAVWHEPFYVKVGGWQTYYDLRNRLILASVYSHRFAIETPKNIIWFMMQALATHDYMSAALLVKAVQDFLQGPSFFDQGADVIHTEVTRISKSLAQTVIPDSAVIPRPKKIRVMPKSDLATALLVIYRISSTLLFCKSGGRQLLMDNETTLANVKARPYVKTNGIGSYRLLYCPDCKKLGSLLLGCLKTFKSYRERKDSAAKEWQADIARLRSVENWELIFDQCAVNRQAALSQSEANG
jgi:galactofuranosylgalactofuranosylrhamnosyl-N-acetylglucosaminyl-diphospho-decaprenol beta-1,5/1,6-galactofuranosyltransferase